MTPKPIGCSTSRSGGSIPPAAAVICGRIALLPGIWESTCSKRTIELVTKVDLPGMKKEDVKVEVMDGHLAVSGERKSETEETQGQRLSVRARLWELLSRLSLCRWG